MKLLTRNKKKEDNGTRKFHKNDIIVCILHLSVQPDFPCVHKYIIQQSCIEGNKCCSIRPMHCA